MTVDLVTHKCQITKTISAAQEKQDRRNKRRRMQRAQRAAGLDHQDGEAGARLILGERAVWKAVILQMLEDATSEAKKPQDSRNREHARAWLDGTSQDFHTVCDLAGFDPAYIRSKVKKALAAPADWRRNATHAKAEIKKAASNTAPNTAPPPSTSPLTLYPFSQKSA